MSELHRAALAIGAAASLLAGSPAATRADPFDAGAHAGPPEAVSPETQAAVALVSGGVAAKAAADPTCPTVTLAPEADTRLSGGATASLDGLARDCANLGAETICKIAVIGESARKKGGAAAAIDAPVTIQIRDADGRDVETRRVNLKVDMPEGVQTVSFNHVEENVSLPPAAAGGYANWTIVVGLDQAGAEPKKVASDEVEAEPAKPARASKTKRSRSARSVAVRRANRVARQQVEVPVAPPVVVSAKPQGAPPAIVSTTVVNGSPMARAAAGFTERRDAAHQQRMQAAQQPAPQQRRSAQPVPQPAARAAQRPTVAPQPEASVRPVQQPAIRTANR